ncbi:MULTISPECIES: FIST signal transduction protein [Aquimarina]|uniref:Histidine kinase n=1 Tax=Aquimarina algiphila TaxID=2047982 RepID=A0A554VPH4_9FLAO|nr:MULTISPECIES: FIST N-terminal domain-containing protein [Aquimarina]TSE10363.1 histidine kinase [Aquimarina algiphila]
MKFQQFEKKKNQTWTIKDHTQPKLKKPLVLVFGNRYALEKESIYQEVKDLFPDGEIIFGSTAGEIIGGNVLDESITLTAIEFEKSTYSIFRENSLDNNKDAIQIGRKLIKKVPKQGLKHIFIVSEGSFINGSALIEGLETMHDEIAITGGLCGDDSRFEKTLASYNENPKEGEVVLIAFYGESLEISFAQYGGWTPFGPERIITKSEQNILYELDNQPALDLYKKYLGDKAAELPQSALLYPLSVKSKDKKESIVRTILTINEEANAMILAGDVPEGSVVQLMMANIDHIVDGALRAAEIGMENRKNKPELALLVSCIGRKLVMDQRVEEEIEEVMEHIGSQSTIAGFYSYGELAPFSGNVNCELHNQTMTLTLFSE